MKRITFFRVSVLFILIVLIVFEKSFAKEYEVLEDTIFTKPHDVCIDPGHGGLTAQKYNNNGDGYGTLGCSYTGDSLSEQWVNLQVSWALVPLMMGYLCPGYGWESVVMTRTGETDIDEPPYGWWWRINVSNHGNAGWPVNEFISVHHNGFETIADQRVESYWCNWPLTEDSSFVRDTDSALAHKVGCRVHDYLNAMAGEEETYKYKETGLKCVKVMRNIVSSHVLSEASDIHMHCDEVGLFEDPYGIHARDEANGIYEGWCSYKRNAGFVLVKNHSLTGDDGWVYITDPGGNWAYFESPYESVWRDDEVWRIDFLTPQYLGGVKDTFHHLRELETGIYSTVPSLTYQVPQCSTHTIIGYYKGGPYSANIYMPDGGEEWVIGDSGMVIWGLGYPGTSPGLDATTLIDGYLDRNSGNDGYPETLFTDIPRLGNIGINCLVKTPPSTKCRVKIIAQDCVENAAMDISTYDFTIRIPNIVGDANSDGTVSNSDVVYLINYLFQGGPPPDPLWKGEVNGDCNVTLSDIVYLTTYLFKGGAPPVECNVNCGWDCQR